MIIGLGNDIIDIRRIEKTVARFGDRFIQRIYTDIEIKKSDRRLNRIESYAKRYAAKEACSKALGTGFRKGVFWKDMGVVNLPSGRPTMKLTGGALKQLQSITPEGMEAVIHLTITDEPPQAQAIVMIEANEIK
ncbi:MAG: holo-ACP synthase [Sneathiella sp.]